MAGKFDAAWSDGWSFWRRHVFFRTLLDIGVDLDDIAFRIVEEERPVTELFELRLWLLRH